MRVKVVWQTGVWLNGEKVKNWEEADIDEALAKELEAKRMVVLMEQPQKGPGRPRKES